MQNHVIHNQVPHLFLSFKGVFNIKGVLAPVFTPVDNNGGLNLSVIPEYARYLSTNMVDGVLGKENKLY